ncbi:FAD-binding molybdopterin dehydrogenase [Gordonia iterans]|uniref:FAD-binding molybdopterin dehydrogenase n=1 Tax=Gordonia iterans TaxID=1004901 RepID=A0A2S0KFD5_9ACTN|nr:FAD binding domain-containing protein [Gordonia iterans]AVM00400.1 FAD-binding molybdopterin dehydrogenase [Gordonia iterans]
MDLYDVQGYRVARRRSDLALAPGEAIVAGGTWMFSEPQPSITGLVDVTGLDWTPIEELGDGLRIAATCTIADLVALPPRPQWPAQRLFADCADALLASFKIWNTATVGGNVCRSFAAASMVSLAVALDGTALIWTPGGGARRLPVAALVTGNGRNELAPGEVLRAIDLPGYALRGRAAMRKIALAELGRSGAVVTGRRDPGGALTFGITAATVAPRVLRYRYPPAAATLVADAEALEGYYTDPLGSADWRRAVAGVLAAEILDELTDGAAVDEDEIVGGVA